MQEQHYDPYGLNLAGLSRSSPGLRPLNKYQFNGVELGNELGLGLNLTLFRLYDPQLGRFHQVDPLADFYPSFSPFSFAAGNPVTVGDPEGLAPEPSPLLKVWHRIKKIVHGAFGYHLEGPWRNPHNPTSHNYWVRNQTGKPSGPVDPLQLITAQLNLPQINALQVPVLNSVIISSIHYPLPTPQPHSRYDDEVDVTSRIPSTFQVDIPFGPGSVHLTDQVAINNVQKLANFLKSHSQMHVLIITNASTDLYIPGQPYTGSATRSQVLNAGASMEGVNSTTGTILLNRARAIQSALIRMGVAPQQIKTELGGYFWGTSKRKATIKLFNPNGK